MDLTGQIVLAFLEEDDTRRVLFRVRPILSAQGIVSTEDLEELGHDGFLRVAPDRQEQHSFKERMRSLGSLCVINLIQAESALGKVRPNKNYAPARGENNRYIIYSDAVQMLPTGLVYEVVPEERRETALTSQYYLRSGGRISGPHCPDGTLACPVSHTLMPDNDRLFLAELPDGTSRMFYWPQESLVQPDAGLDAQLEGAAPADAAKDVQDTTTLEQPGREVRDEVPLMAAADSILHVLSTAGFALDRADAAHLLVLLMAAPRVQLLGETPADSAHAKAAIAQLFSDETRPVRFPCGPYPSKWFEHLKRYCFKPWPVFRLKTGDGVPAVSAARGKIDLLALKSAAVPASFEGLDSHPALSRLMNDAKAAGQPLPLPLRSLMARALALGASLPDDLAKDLSDTLEDCCVKPYRETLLGYRRLYREVDAGE